VSSGRVRRSAGAEFVLGPLCDFEVLRKEAEYRVEGQDATAGGTCSVVTTLLMKHEDQETDRAVLRRMDMSAKDDLLAIISDPVTMSYYPTTRSRAELEKWGKRACIRCILKNDIGL